MGTTLSLAVVAFIIGRFSSGSSPSLGSGSAQSLPGFGVHLASDRRSPGNAMVNASASASAVSTADPSPREGLSSSWSEQAHARLLAQPHTPASIAALATLLRKLAATDPARALALAEAERNQLIRAALFDAVLTGWAQSAPNDAARWALALDNEKRDHAIGKVFGALSERPTDAVGLADRLTKAYPGEAAVYGQELIEALSASGNFNYAASWAASQDPTQRSLSTTSAYEKWSQFQPPLAAQAALTISNPEARADALRGVISGWGAADPEALTQFLSQQLPVGQARAEMLGQALQTWLRSDPARASAWIETSASNDEKDEGIAIMSQVSKLTPQVALGLAGEITDGALRSSTLTQVMQRWARSDPNAALDYLTTSEMIKPREREQIASSLEHVMRP